MSNEEEEEDDKISSLLSEMQIKTKKSKNHEEIISNTNELALQTAADLEKELTKFRNEWKNEMSSKIKMADNKSESQTGKNIAVYHEFPHKKTSVNQEDVEPETTKDSDCEYDQPENSEDKAAYLFNKGVLLEQHNRYFEAIQFYRMAMQIDPDIEFKSCSMDESKEPDQTSTEINDIVINVDAKAEDDNEDTEKTLYDQFQTVVKEENSFCVKKTPQNAMHFSDLPIEVVMLILKWVVGDHLDVKSLENFSNVCKGFYVCARDPEIWKLACAKIWGLDNISSQLYSSWRKMYLTRPRLNFDGAYISKTSYARAGEKSLDNFYSPWHLVEYYRYFRFYTNGTVVFLTCADEPKNAVSKLKTPAISGEQNILKGTWKLNDSTVYMLFKKKRLLKKSNKYSRKQNVSKDNLDKEETFRIELIIDSETKKQSSQLRWSNYEIDIVYKSMNKKTNTKLDLNKVDFPQFYFSRVKSYMKEAENPLN